MMSADYQYSATLTPTRSSNHPLICKIRSRSTPVCSHMRPQCVALEYGAKPITLRHLNTCHSADAPVWPILRPRDQTSKVNQIYTPDCARCQRRSGHGFPDIVSRVGETEAVRKSPIRRRISLVKISINNVFTCFRISESFDSAALIAPPSASTNQLLPAE